MKGAALIILKMLIFAVPVGRKVNLVKKMKTVATQAAAAAAVFASNCLNQ